HGRLHSLPTRRSSDLEQTLGAVLWLTARPRAEHSRQEEWQAVMQGIADASRLAYKRLVYDRPDFVRYFREATPIDVIERLNIGSDRKSTRLNSSHVKN